MGRQPLTYINYISFRHAEILPKIIIKKISKIFFKILFLVIENEVSFGMFRNISFVKMKSSKLNNHLAETR